MTRNRPIRPDRMLIEEAGPDPARQARALLEQLPRFTGPVPVYEIAKALDIVEIRVERTHGLEAVLVTDPERSEGRILVNAASPRRRRRFSIAHELGHFLNPTHRPTHAEGSFSYTSKHLARVSPADQAELSRHIRQEDEANRFAIELLAPKYLVDRFLVGPPDVAAITAMAEQLDISREACARRYVELSPHHVAVIFFKDETVRYGFCGADFPFYMPPTDVILEGGYWLPIDAGPADCIRTDAGQWGDYIPISRIWEQRLCQRGGFAMNLLSIR